MRDRFFSQSYCSRCGGDLSEGRTMSMFNTDCICMSCKDKERSDSEYRKAQQAELEQVQQGNYNYEGIRGGK